MNPAQQGWLKLLRAHGENDASGIQVAHSRTLSMRLLSVSNVTTRCWCQWSQHRRPKTSQLPTTACWVRKRPPKKLPPMLLPLPPPLLQSERPVVLLVVESDVAQSSEGRWRVRRLVVRRKGGMRGSMTGIPVAEQPRGPRTTAQPDTYAEQTEAPVPKPTCYELRIAIKYFYYAMDCPGKKEWHDGRNGTVAKKL